MKVPLTWKRDKLGERDLKRWLLANAAVSTSRRRAVDRAEEQETGREITKGIFEAMIVVGEDVLPRPNSEVNSCNRM